MELLVVNGRRVCDEKGLRGTVDKKETRLLQDWKEESSKSRVQVSRLETDPRLCAVQKDAGASVKWICPPCSSLESEEKKGNKLGLATG